jgi:hypothetical protein
MAFGISDKLYFATAVSIYLATSSVSDRFDISANLSYASARKATRISSCRRLRSRVDCSQLDANHPMTTATTESTAIHCDVSNAATVCSRR